MDKSKQDLILDNMQLVYHTLHKYYPTYAFDEDIQQIGMLGLCKAANTYDETKSKFSTYAVKCIVNQVRMELRSRSRRVDAISLESVVSESSDGDTVELGDVCMGEPDVGSTIAVLDALDDRERKVVELRYAGLDVNEIAKQLGLSRATISKVISQTKIKLSKTK